MARWWFTTTFAHRACFLVWAQVPDWQEFELPLATRTSEDVARFVSERAAAVGLPPGEPFPFLVAGRVEAAALHILDKRDERPHDAAEHERVKVHFRLRGEEVQILGFHSAHHRGVFTPRGSDVHTHVRTIDGAMAGHLDTVTLAGGARAYLPRPGAPRE